MQGHRKVGEGGREPIAHACRNTLKLSSLRCKWELLVRSCLWTVRKDTYPRAAIRRVIAERGSGLVRSNKGDRRLPFCPGIDRPASQTARATETERQRQRQRG
eukprot:2784702-Rhodomonas_salina.1